MEDKVSKPRLENKKAFEELLKTYAPSDKTVELLAKIPLVILCGPTAAGRNTLISLLEETGKYSMLISDTTRAPRTNNGIMEVSGKEYWFKKEEEFLNMLKAGEYIEAAIVHGQQVSGTSVKEVERLIKSNKIALNEIEVEGVKSYLKIKPDATALFILPPSFEVWLERLKKRGGMSEEEMTRRLQTAYKEITIAFEADYYLFVINDEIHELAKRVDRLIREGEELTDEEQERAKAHAQQLAIDVKLFLSS